jgi:three-Cys-motif partner protein
MTKHRDHFESFAPHTLLKHAVYGFYVERWSRILLKYSDSVRIVDACAGEGGDVTGNPGSPLIALRNGAAAARQLTASSGVPKRVELVAIEKTLKNFRSLEERIGSEPNVRLVHGTLADIVESLGKDSAAVPHLYFIDPFGVSPLKADVIRRALRGPRNEVFLLFAGPAIRRHFGAYEGVFASDEELEQGSLFSDLGSTAAVSLPTPHQQIAAESSVAILDAAFGDADWRSLLTLPDDQRLMAAVELFCDVLCGLGAKRVLPMPILDRHHKLNIT